MIQKEVDPKDKRSHLISLTEAGGRGTANERKRSKAHQEMLTYLTAEENKPLVKP